MHKQGVKKLRYLLFIRKVKCTFEGNPHALEMHRANLDDMPNLLALQNAVTSPSSHASDVKQLGSVDHVVIFSSSDANSSGFNLKAEAALVFPQCSRDPRFRIGWGYLTRCIEALILAL